MAIDLILPESCKPAAPRNAQLRTKVIFYKHSSSGRYSIGFPEQFPAPVGYEKIVCNHAYEVEKWDKVLRHQEAMDRERTAEERESVEGPMRDHLRSLLRQGKANARNQLNKDFCDQSLQRLDIAEAERKKETVESYMHVEAFEAGK